MGTNATPHRSHPSSSSRRRHLPAWRVAVALIAAIAVLQPLPALAHGEIDQVNHGKDNPDETDPPACSAAEYPGTVLVPAGTESRQSFVPTRGGLASVELCVQEIIGIPGPDFTLRVYEGGTAADPGDEGPEHDGLIFTKEYDTDPDPTDGEPAPVPIDRWVHVDVDDPETISTTPGKTYVLGVTPTKDGASSVVFRWRATCTDDLLTPCESVPDTYRGENGTNDLPSNADYGFRTFPVHEADLVPTVTVDPLVCPGLNLNGRATGTVENVSHTSVGPFDTQWYWSEDATYDEAKDQPLGSPHRVDGLAADADASIPPPTLPPEPDLPHGDGHLMLRIDVAKGATDAYVVESNEANNTAVAPTAVTVCGQPAIAALTLSVDEEEVPTGVHERQFTDLDPAALATLPQSPLEAAAGPAASANGFSANGFSANGFSANGFSANGFSANGFSANGFSANGFSANGFSPNGANGFSANGFSPAGDVLLSTVLADLPRELPEQMLVVDVPITGEGWAARLPGDKPIQDYTLAEASALLPGLTLEEVDLTAVFGMSWLGLALSGGTLNDTPLPDGRDWCAFMAELGSDCTAVGVDPATTSLLKLEATGFPSFRAPIADLPLSAINLQADFLVRTFPLAQSADTTRFSLEHTRLGRLAADKALTDPNVVFDCGANDCSRPMAALAAEDAARDVTVGVLLDGLTADGTAEGVVGDLGLGSASLDTLNLATANWNLANVHAMDPACPSVRYHLTGQNTGSGPAVDPTAEVTLPAGFVIVPGTTELDVDGVDGPAQGEPGVAVDEDGVRTYTFHLDGQFSSSFDLSFSTCAGVYLGAVDAGEARLTGEGIDGEYSASTDGSPTDSVLVAERTPGVTTHPLTFEDNIVVFDHIGRSNEHDSMTFEVKPEAGILYEVKLFVPPGAELDLLAFGPQTSANGFSANGFSANGFSANGFSANGFSANGFSANGFSANGFSPTLSSETLDDQPVDELAPPDSSGVYVSANRGDQVETLYLLGNHGDAGSFTFSVTDYGSRSFAPYVLTVQTHTPNHNPLLDTCDAPPWDLGELPGTAPAAWQGTEPPRTLFVVNRQVTASAYGVLEAQKGIAALEDLAARPDVSGIVLEVDHDPAVRSAYENWAGDWCSPTAANAVATHIRSQILDLRTDHPTIDTIVVAGGDPLIPDFRLPDHLYTGNEYQYVDALLKTRGANNATIAAFAERTLMSPDPYGNEDPVAFGPTLAFPPSAGVSRLVESPADWIAQRDQYFLADGLLAPGKGLVTGYDGFLDGAEAAAQVLRDADVTTDLLSDKEESWSAADLRGALTPSPDAPSPDIAGINAHTNHWAVLSDVGSRDNDETEIIGSDEATRFPIGGQVFSNGCHFGTSVVDLLNKEPTEAEAKRLRDWSQAIAAGRQGVAVANSGFGIFDTEVVAQGEKLQVLYLEELQTSRNASLALARAKNRFFATIGVHDAFKYKTIHQLTMYGPGTYAMLGATEPPTGPPPEGDGPIPVDAGPYTVETEGSTCETCYLLGQIDVGTEVTLRDPGVDTGNTSVSGYWSAPTSSRKVRRPDGTLSAGVWINGIESESRADIDPVITRLAKSRDDNETEPQLAAPFPTTLVQASDVGSDTFVTFLHGLNQPTRRVNGDIVSDVHLYTEIDAELLLRPDTTVGCRPHIDEVHVATDEDGTVAVFDVSVSELCGPNDRVGVVARDDTGEWHVRDLNPVAGRWRGAVALSPGATEIEDLLVQASNGLGVAHWRNKGDRPLVLTDPVGQIDVTLTGDRHNGVYTGDVLGTILGVDGVSYRVYDGEALIGTFPSGASFTIAGEGIHELAVIGTDGSIFMVAIAIDTSTPTIQWHAPDDGTVVTAGKATLVVDVTCSDTVTGADCAISVNGTPIENGSVLPTDLVGEYTVAVVASDAAGHSHSDARTYTVVSRYETSGFHSPIAPKPTVNSVTSGSDIPVKFNLTEDGTEVTDPAVVSARRWRPISCTSFAVTGAEFDAIGGAPAYSGFFHFNVKAPMKKGCYELVVRLDDGSELTAYFRVK